MARDTFTFKAEGGIELRDLTGSLQLLMDFVQALSTEIAKEATIRWYVEDLKHSSATATLRGEVAATETSEAAEKVIRGIGVVATSLLTGDRIPYSEKVQEAAFALTRAIQRSITAIHLQTDEIGDVILTAPVEEEDERALRTRSLGTIDGIVQTLQRREVYSFTLYDTLLDRSVRCYLEKDQEDKMREAWGKRVRVTGMIGRDPITGRAMDIREVWDVAILPEIAPDSYKAALGILESDDPAPPEALVRRLRDAG